MPAARAPRPWLATAVAVHCCLGVALPPAAVAQQFEGVIRIRSVSLHSDQVDQLLSDLANGTDEDQDEEMSEEQYRQRTAAKLLGVSMDAVFQFARESDGDITEIALYVRGGKIRQEITETGAPRMVGLVDLDARTFLLLNMDERYYVDMGQLVETLRDAPAQGAGQPAPGRPAARDRGKTATVGGMPCREYEVTTDEAVIVGCVASGQRPLERAVRAFAERTQAAFSGGEDQGYDDEDALWEQGLPVRTQRFNLETGYDAEEIVAVERKPIAADQFVVPAGFTKKTVEEMMSPRN